MWLQDANPRRNLTMILMKPLEVISATLRHLQCVQTYHLYETCRTLPLTTTNRAYDRRMKINNLKEMADTIIYMEEHGIDSRISLEKAYDNRLHKTSEARSALRKSEDAIKGLNEQIHYTGQYLANKGVYNDYMKARDKSRFRIFSIVLIKILYDFGQIKCSMCITCDNKAHLFSPITPYLLHSLCINYIQATLSLLLNHFLRTLFNNFRHIIPKVHKLLLTNLWHLL